MRDIKLFYIEIRLFEFKLSKCNYLSIFIIDAKVKHKKV